MPFMDKNICLKHEKVIKSRENLKLRVRLEMVKFNQSVSAEASDFTPSGEGGGSFVNDGEGKGRRGVISYFSVLVARWQSGIAASSVWQSGS